MLCDLISLPWRHNDHDGVSNHQSHGCLLNRLFRRRSKKTSKLRVTGPLCGEFTGTGEFPAQRASNAEMFLFDDVIMWQITCNYNGLDGGYCDGQVTTSWQCWACPWPYWQPMKFFNHVIVCVLWNLLKMKKYDRFHIIDFTMTFTL